MKVVFVYVINSAASVPSLEAILEEERQFEIQYSDWKKQYNDWKEQNKSKSATNTLFRVLSVFLDIYIYIYIYI